MWADLRSLGSRASDNLLRDCEVVVDVDGRAYLSDGSENHAGRGG